MMVEEAVRFFQAVGQHERLVGEQRNRWAMGNEAAFVQDQNAGAKVNCQFQVMSGDQLGARQVSEQGLELAPATGVEVAGWFIEYQDARLAGKDAGEADTPFLAVAQPVRFALFESRQPDQVQRTFHARAEGVPFQAQLSRAEGHVFEYGGGDELVVLFYFLEGQGAFRAAGYMDTIAVTHGQWWVCLQPSGSVPTLAIPPPMPPSASSCSASMGAHGCGMPNAKWRAACGSAGEGHYTKTDPDAATAGRTSALKVRCHAPTWASMPNCAANRHPLAPSSRASPRSK